jgi:phosphopantothenoylcysteine decarboxylase/phosphopantothenate--cysteine ligase
MTDSGNQPPAACKICQLPAESAAVNNSTVMKILITCGPSYEPIDGARRMTNMSTGRLGVTLANFFTDSGHEVICLKGEGSTHPGEVRASTVASFSTNDDLAQLLESYSRLENVDAVLHAAALCDFRVEQVLSATGEAMQSAKFATRDGRLHVILAPATKILSRLREWFPEACLVGWKYELAGTRGDAFAKAWKQLRECDTEACVLNGAAYGDGYALCVADGATRPCADTPTLCKELLDLLSNRAPTRTSAGIPAL